MNVWKVGGAVRDRLLGRVATAGSDIDWVVTGSTPEAMRAAGYLAVGRDFPVFLHPVTKQEYALARTERKTAPGYHGFVFHTDATVTLEADLQRRDLTINAMAEDEAGVVTDPYGGQRDLAARLLRHVSPAFAEDPVRILRVARFAARFGDFSVAPQTQALMREMVCAGEVDALVAERVWQELSRGLMEASPSRMVDVLHDCGALARLLPEVDADWSATNGQTPPHAAALRRAIDLTARHGAPLPVRFAVLTHRVAGADALAALCDRWRIPTDCREVAAGLLRERDAVRDSGAMDAERLVCLLDRCDAWRRPERFALLLQSCAALARAEWHEGDATRAHTAVHSQAASIQPRRLQAALARAAAVDAGAVAQAAAAQGHSGPAIGNAVHAARVRAVAEDLNDIDGETND
jgi:tRNA nucleotidyltransferase (CCA-adding enzyme)